MKRNSYFYELFRINIFEKIYAVKKKGINGDTSAIENRLDLMLYKLHNLTYDECQVVDPDVVMFINREDYENTTIETLSDIHC